VSLHLPEHGFAFFQAQTHLFRTDSGCCPLHLCNQLTLQDPVSETRLDPNSEFHKDPLPIDAIAPNFYTVPLFRDIAERANPEDIPLITTDGFEFYERVIGQVFGPACVYGQVVKTRRNNRIVKVERRAVIGTEGRFEQRLQQSEDSSTLNTSFIERLNLTIRQESAYLCRRTICHARWRQRLEGHLELLRCYYNLVRPHRALRFGREIRTPAMQAGLIGKRLTLHEMFWSGSVFLASCEMLVFVYFEPSFSIENALPRAA
jgi:IS1 family transposase